MVTEMNNAKLLLLIILCFLSGCSNYKELNEVSVVVGMGIDYDAKTHLYEVVLELINPAENSMQAGSGGRTVPIVAYTGTGKTLSEASRYAAKKIPREHIYSHIALVVIGEQLAKKESLNFIFDAFERDAKARTNVPILIARNTSVYNVMGTLSQLDKLPVRSIIGKIHNVAQSSGENAETKVYQVVEALSSPGREPTISGISIIGNEKKGITTRNLETMDKAYTVINGIGVFQNGKLVGWLDEEKGKSIQLIQNQLKQTNVMISCNQKRYNSVLVNYAHSDVKVDVQNNQVMITIRLHAAGILDEVLCNKDLKSPIVIKEFERKAEKELKKQLKAGITTAQKLESDAFGFGDILRRTHPVKWKKQKQNWNQRFADAKINIDVIFDIEGTGMRSKAYPY